MTGGLLKCPSTGKKIFGKKLSFLGVFIGNIFFMSKVVRLTESELVKLVRKAINEQLKLRSGSMGDIMALQTSILSHEIENNIAKVIPNNPAGCNSQTYREQIYEQGQKNQCRISGTTLCQGPCFQSQAIDGIYGPRTKAAYEKYKDIEIESGGEKYTLQQINDPDLFSTTDSWSKSRTENWQIPAEMDNIKAFQHWVWIYHEKDLPGDQRGYKSILCGGNFCEENKAVDGYWGANTKKAWNELGQEYLKDHTVDSEYEEVRDLYKDYKKKFRGIPYNNNQPVNQDVPRPWIR